MFTPALVVTALNSHFPSPTAILTQNMSSLSMVSKGEQSKVGTVEGTWSRASHLEAARTKNQNKTRGHIMILVSSAQSQSPCMGGQPLYFVHSLNLTLEGEQGLPTIGWKNGKTQPCHRPD